MRVRPCYLLMLAGCLFMGATGVVLGATGDGNYCDVDTDACLVTDVTVQDTCCVDPEYTGTRHLATCQRDRYECPLGDSSYFVWGSAYNCQDLGTSCQ